MKNHDDRRIRGTGIILTIGDGALALAGEEGLFRVKLYLMEKGMEARKAEQVELSENYNRAAQEVQRIYWQRSNATQMLWTALKEEKE